MIEPMFMVNEFLEERQQLENIINQVNTKEKKFQKEAYLLKELLRYAIIHYKKDDKKEKLKKELEFKKEILLNKINQIKTKWIPDKIEPKWIIQSNNLEVP